MHKLTTAEFFERTSDCVLVLDAAWKVRLCNERARQELRLPDLQGAYFWDAFPEARGSIFEERYRLAMETQASQTFEAYYPDLESWYDIHAVPVGLDLAIFFRNITDRRAAMEKAEARHQTLDALFDQVFLGILQLDEDGRPILANQYLCSMLGRSAATLLSQSLNDWVHPDDITLLREQLRFRKARWASPEFEIRLLGADGGIRWCSLRLTFAQDAMLRRYTILVCKDVTDLHEQQRKAREAAALLQAIVDSAEDLIFVKDMAGRFVLTNRRLDEAGPPLLGRTVAEEYSPELAAGYAAGDRAVLDDGKALAVEELIPVGGTARMFQTIKVPWRVGAKYVAS